MRRFLDYFTILISFLFSFQDAFANTEVAVSVNATSATSTTAKKAKRGSTYELRFSKNHSALYDVNIAEDGIYEISANYSSKNSLPKVELSSNAKVIDLDGKSTKGHGNFQRSLFNQNLTLRKGVNKIKISSFGQNFYLKKFKILKIKNISEHDITSPIKAWEYSESNMPVNKAKRGSSFEVRFKKGQSLKYSVTNPLESNTFRLMVYYSSKKVNPKLTFKLGGESYSSSDLVSTNGHGSYTQKVALAHISLPKGSSELEILSLSNNFYLKQIKLSETEPVDDSDKNIHLLPSFVKSTKFSSSSEEVLIGNRGSSKEVRLKVGQTIQYKVKVDKKLDLDLFFNYSSARTTPKLDLQIDNRDWIDFSLENTKSHGDYKTRKIPNIISLDPGTYTLKVKAKTRNFYFKGINAKESVTKKLNRVYGVNVGGESFSDWVSDIGKNNEVVVLDKAKNKNFFMFGSADDKIVNNINNEFNIHPSVPNDVDLNIFNSYRGERMDPEHHVPGIHYSFAINSELSYVRLHFMLEGDSKKLVLFSNSSLNHEEINLPAVSNPTAFSIEKEIKNLSGNELNIGLLSKNLKESFSLVGIELLSSQESSDHSSNEIPKIFISPNGAGNKSGSSISNAKPFKSLNSAISSLSSTGGEILLLSNKGTYSIKSSMNITKGGESSDKVVIIKTYRENDHSTKALFRGTRIAPWVNKSNSTGKEFIRLLKGANHLSFEDIAFENFGNGIFRIADSIENLTLRRIRAKNFTRLVENYHTGSASHASVKKLNLEDIEAYGYTRGVIRLKYAGKDIKLSRVLGDSQGQLDAKDFPMGIALDNNVSNVEIRKSLLKNHRQKKSSNSSYFNGDGIATESNVSSVLIEDTISSGNSDGGFDLKSTQTILKRTLAQNNKRNYRFWNGAELQNVLSFNPEKFGGSGNKVHFGAYGSRDFEIKIFDIDVVDESPNARVFSVGENKKSSMTIDGGLIYIKGNPNLTDSPGRVNIKTSTTIEIEN